MLVQSHRDILPDFYGLTTSFRRDRLKPGVTVLADEPGAPWVKYIRGDFGKGTWTYVGLGLWRQLPAGVPGAYRIMANLVSKPRVP